MVAFVSVINAASYTGAARQLGTSKSVISRRISEMEQHLGTRLIDRSSVRVRVTEAGAAYYERCVSILESVEEANDLVTGFHGGIRGMLRVSAPHLYGVHVLSPLINEFAANHAALKVDIGVEEQDAISNDTSYDLWIRIGRLASSSLIARTLAASRSWMCASPEYLAARGAPNKPDDLEVHDCLISSGGGVSPGWQLHVDGVLKTFRVRERLRSACHLQLLEAACSGLGLALLPDYAIADAISSGRLQTVMTEYEPPTSPVSIVYPPSRRSSQKVQTFIQFLADRIRCVGISM